MKLSIMKNNFVFFLILWTLVIAVSCKKYLDRPTSNSLAVPNTLSDLQGLLDDADVMNDPKTPSYGEASSDDYFLPLDAYNSVKDASKQTYTWTPHDYFASNDWSYGYLPIYNSNYCLETLEKIPVTPNNKALWNNIRGSSFFFRAYYFLGLSWVYSNAYDKNTSATDLGIVLRLGSDFNVKSVRSSVQQTYDRIILDAKQSIDYLPDLPKHPMRPSKAAAYGLLARTYLSMRQYDSAFRYSDLCLQLKNTLLDYSGADVNINSDVPFQPFNKEIIFYSVMNISNSITSPYFARIDTALYESYRQGDLRKSTFFIPNGAYQQFRGNYNTAYSDQFFSGIAVDEMYLTRAECYARLNNENAALEDLNTLLINRWDNIVPYVPITAATPKEALQSILQERRKELLFRGLRWVDIKRLNKEGAEIVLKRKIGDNIYQLSPNENKYALPLPTDIVRLTGVQQNPH